MRAVFITGTDTGVGKTVITGLLARFFLEKKYSAITQKWVGTGVKGFSADIDIHLKLMKKGRNDLKEFIPYMAPYVFRHPSSPHLASALEGKKIDIGKIKRSFKYLSGKFDFVVVEGAGGALVPIDKRKLVIDIARQLRLPVLIVSANKLGAINHTLLTVEAVRKRNMRIIGILFNTLSGKTDSKVIKDNPRIIHALSGEKILGSLPWSTDTDYLYKQFIPLGKKILKWITG